MKQILAHIDEIVHREFKMYCAKKDLKMGETLEKLILRFVEESKKEEVAE